MVCIVNQLKTQVPEEEPCQEGPDATVSGHESPHSPEGTDSDFQTYSPSSENLVNTDFPARLWADGNRDLVCQSAGQLV